MIVEHPRATDVPLPAWDGEPLDVREAFDRLDAYGRSYGQLALRLLLHAAVPQGLRPDLVNLLRVNFVPEAGRDASIDADVLFSPLVEHSGASYYRLDTEIRRHCLALLDAVYSPVPEPRSRRVARFLLAYTESAERRFTSGPDPLLREFLDIQRWVAIAFLDPSRAAARFAEALQREVEAGATALHLRLSGLAAALAIPLTGHAELIVYARGLDALVSGDFTAGRTIMERLGDREMEIGGIRLTAPTRVLLAFAEKEEQPLRDVRLYVCFAEKDREIAALLLDLFRREGAEVLPGIIRDIRAGRPVDSNFRTAIQIADCTVVLWSFAAAKSELLRHETTTALRSGKLLPAWLDDSPIVPELRAIYHADLRGWRGEREDRQFRDLVTAIARMAAAQKGAAAARARAATLPDLAAVDAPWCPEMVALPAGEFLMGSPEDDKERYNEESPQHRVTIGQRFALGRYPVTFDEYDYFCVATKRKKPEDQGWGRGKRPVINVSWRDATAYCEWLSKKTGHRYRLPSEAEWEYACRAGRTTRYSFGDEITENDANYGRVIAKTTEVGLFTPNNWGIFDMHGNVWEWVDDNWHDSYSRAPSNGSAWTDSARQVTDNRLRVVRGGSWNVSPRVCRCASRDSVQPDYRRSNIGFRVARPIETDPLSAVRTNGKAPGG